MEYSQTDVGSATGSAPAMLDIMVQQVRAYEDQHGMVEPLDPKDASSGGYALTGLMEQRVAAIKGILIATGQAARLLRLEDYSDPATEQAQLLMRGVMLRPNAMV